MTSRLHLASCYNEISQHVERAAGWLESALPESGLYPRAAIIARLRQRLADAVHLPLLRARRAEALDGRASGKTHTIALGGITLDSANGVVHVTAGVLARSFAEFAKHWLLALWGMTRALRPAARPGRSPATLVLGAPGADIAAGGDDSAFLAFCRSGPVAPLRSAGNIIVQANEPRTSSRPDTATYARWPLLEIASQRGLKATEYLRFLAGHVCAAARFVAGVVQMPLTCLLARDFAYHAAAAALNHASAIEGVVLTNTYFNDQLLWMTDLPGRRFRAHLVFYSMMGSAFVYREHPLHAVFPGFRFLRADEFWVWTEGQARLLHDLGVAGAVHVAGPMVWRLPETQAPARGNSAAITVFDVTPVTETVAGEFGLAYNYYCTKNALKFLDDILATGDEARGRLGLDLRVALKHKRGYAATVHDSVYIDRIEAARARVDLLPPETNIHALLASSALAIVIPFSSPAYVAAYLGVPAIYYDPTGELMPTAEPHPLIRHAAGREELLQAVLALLSENAAGNRAGGRA